MASGITKSTTDRFNGTTKKNTSPVSGKRPKTTHGSGMSAGTTNFADHLRSRCETIGVSALADALDRLEAPCEDEVTGAGSEATEAMEPVAETRAQLTGVTA
jgi:hypothetical protein